MTVSSQTNKVIYIGNGVAKEFAIPFSFLEQEHIKVRQKKNDIQTERTDWTVKSGNLVFTDAPESGAEIAIVREVPLTQETDYRDNEILHAETLERNFDKLTMQVQQLAEKQDRAVTVDIFDDTQAAELIPSIRKAVSDCQTAAKTSTMQATIATTQAGIAGEKVEEAVKTLAQKADVNAANFSSVGKSVLSGLGMPGTKRINLTLSESGAIYTPPANGYISLRKHCEFANQFVEFDSQGFYANFWCPYASGNIGFTLPVSAGKSFTIIYNASGETIHFVFIYAKGEE